MSGEHDLDERVWVADDVEDQITIGYAFTPEAVAEILAEISRRIREGRAIGLCAAVDVDLETLVPRVRVWNEPDLTAWRKAWLPEATTDSA